MIESNEKQHELYDEKQWTTMKNIMKNNKNHHKKQQDLAINCT